MFSTSYKFTLFYLLINYEPFEGPKSVQYPSSYLKKGNKFQCTSSQMVEVQKNLPLASFILELPKFLLLLVVFLFHLNNKTKFFLSVSFREYCLGVYSLLFGSREDFCWLKTFNYVESYLWLDKLTFCFVWYTFF